MKGIGQFAAMLMFVICVALGGCNETGQEPQVERSPILEGVQRADVGAVEARLLERLDDLPKSEVRRRAVIFDRLRKLVPEREDYQERWEHYDSLVRVGTEAQERDTSSEERKPKANPADIRDAERFLSSLPRACAGTGYQVAPDGTVVIRLSCHSPEKSLVGVVEIKDGVVRKIE